MTVLTILGVLAALGALAYGCSLVNDYAKASYGFEVFSKRNVLFMFVPIGLVILSAFFLEPGESIPTAVQQGNLDVILLLVLAVGSIVGFFVYVARESNFWIAAFAAVVLFVAAIVIILVLYAIAVARSGDKRRR